LRVGNALSSGLTGGGNFIKQKIKPSSLGFSRKSRGWVERISEFARWMCGST
jgi:hypothetical protein